MKTNAKYYMQIVNPIRNDYDNRKEYYWLVQSLDYLSNKFNIVQIRIALIALFDAKERGVISSKKFKEFIHYIEGFHFVYNALLTYGTNKLDSVYASFARNVRKSNTKDKVNAEIDILKKRFDEWYPPFEEFRKEFINLKYSGREDHPDNLKVKYIINTLACHESATRKDLFYDDGSIEHIYPEGSGEKIALNIGNLILLEQTLNGDAGDNQYEDKIAIYRKSKYDCVKVFIDSHPEWNQSFIPSRAEELAQEYYYEVLGRK